MLKAFAMADGPMGEAPTGVWATRRAWWGVLLVVWLMSAAWVGHYTFRGWIPHDEGTIGQSAERVLLGERPHEDFDDVYTGGLSYLNAAAMATFGMNLRSPRIVLAAAFLLCIPVFYYAASRFAGPLGAGLTTLVAVAWGPPVYMAALPSWYNTILAIAALAACLRYVDTDHRRWLFVAGLCAGLSFLLKIVGLYLLASLLLFAAFVEIARARHPTNDRQAKAVGLYTAVLAIGAVLLITIVWQLLRSGRDANAPAYLLPPVISVAAVLVALNIPIARRGLERSRFHSLASLCWPVAVGFLIPTVMFLVPYIIAGTLGAFMHDVFVVSQRRLMVMQFSFPPLGFNGTLFALVVFAFYYRRFGATANRIALASLIAVLLTALVLSRGLWEAYQPVWGTLRLAPAVLVPIGVLLIARRTNLRDGERPSQLYAVLAVTSMMALTQFPFSSPGYFCYVAPLVALSVLAIFVRARYKPLSIPLVLGVFYASFGAWNVTAASHQRMGVNFAPDPEIEVLALPRAGIHVSRHDADTYELLIPMLQELARGGHTLAMPSAPEVYYLAGLRNPTRTLFDVLDDTVGKSSRTLAALDRHGVTAVVINRQPEFAFRIPDDLRRELQRRYPNDTLLGEFELRWQR